MKRTGRKRLRSGLAAALAVAVLAGLTQFAAAQEAKKDQPGQTAPQAAQEPTKPQQPAQPGISPKAPESPTSQPGTASPLPPPAEGISPKAPGRNLGKNGPPPKRPVNNTPTPTVQLKPGEVPAIEFDTPTYDFGRVKAGSPVEHDFWFTNKGNGPLEILSAKAG